MNVLQAVCMRAFYVSILGVDWTNSCKPLETLIKLCNSPYGRRWRLYILPQFLSNLTGPITHKVIFCGGGAGGSEIRRCNSNIVYPRFEVYKTFLCVFMDNSMVFMR